MKKILFYTNIPSPYRVDFFNELGKYCDLTVLFEIDSSTERDDSWKEYEFKNFTGIILKGIRTHLDRAFCPSIIKYLKPNRYDHIVISVLASATAILAVTWLKFNNIDYCFEGDGAIASGKYGLKGVVKSYIIKKSRICFSTSRAFDDYCRLYGANGQIVRYPFSSVKNEDIIQTPLCQEKKNDLRKRLGLQQKHILLGVGRVVSIKGWDVLISASEVLGEDWEVYIVGGECTEEYRKLIDENAVNNIHFIDFIPRGRMAEYYQAADVFCLPTRYDPWGLVINEAMANGIPVITTKQCVAGLEMVSEGENGYLYDCEDVVALKSILHMIQANCDEETLYSMGKSSLQTAKRYTIETMVRAHLEAWQIEI